MLEGEKQTILILSEKFVMGFQLILRGVDRVCHCEMETVTSRSRHPMANEVAVVTDIFISP